MRRLRAAGRAQDKILSDRLETAQRSVVTREMRKNLAALTRPRLQPAEESVPPAAGPTTQNEEGVPLAREKRKRAEEEETAGDDDGDGDETD